MRFVDAPDGMSADPPAPGAAPESTTLWVEPTHRLGSGSHLVASLPAAEALAVVGEDVPEVGVGDEVGLIALSASAAPGSGHPRCGPAASAGWR